MPLICASTDGRIPVVKRVPGEPALALPYDAEGMDNKPEQCLFCAIAAGEEEAAVVPLGDERFTAFLDHRPVFPGHVLVVPVAHRATLADMAPADLGPLFTWVQRVERAVVRAMDAQGSFIAVNNVVSQSVPHLHVHVVPRRRRDGLRGFFWPRTRYASQEEMRGVAAAIGSALEGTS